MKFSVPRTVTGAFIALALLLPAVPAPVAVAAAGYVPGAGFLNKIHLPGVDVSQPKLESHLAALAAQHSGAAPLTAPRMQSLGVFNNTVRVVVQATSSSTVGAARNAVTAAGGRVEETYADLIQAVVPTSALTPLAQSAVVRQVRQPARMLKTSLATDEGGAVSQADIWHQSGITGEGIKVAVIDGGFANLSAEQAAGALPNSLTTVDDCPGPTQGTTDFSSNPHGTAVAEIVHAMAPQAQLTLVCAETDPELGVAEQYAVTNGIQIINSSQGTYGTSRGDGNGPPVSPEAIVADANAHGILWVNSAGNAATDHWSGVMNPNSRFQPVCAGRRWQSFDNPTG